ncbi:zinc-dependent alcohol dehydrogenase family protein [Flavitalea sp. BT771]|uniref:quinone oxidoreductase family protein n=1 Tax=Flavitalea sp. BT771 TaxID=3063329 RepID=UPI0026E28C43|nr:zinc-dependent alcohol dehydrogenase family protein [Flavitalea sp. BT771]MDO6435157.1 zinc-dependent alcohol dehydrogenase family protein [Flavitalea sp. BT771]MDV6224138.1 zinc-dependent alcohol dehydrogenase family protein [Flavitalea sp. BT771]
MQAIAFNKVGSPAEVLTLIEKEQPVPAEGEVLVKMLASPIHPADTFFIQGTYRFQPEFPDETAGFEGAGIVERVGKGVTVAAGSLVAFFGRRAWAEYVTVPAGELAVLPAGFPVEKAAQFSLNPFTAWGLLETARPVAGEWMLLTGANSSVSQILIQLAHRSGVRIIALVRDLAQADGLRALGADEVLDIEDQGLGKRVQELTGGKGFNVALDAIGGAIGTKIFELIAPFGRFVLYGSTKKEPAQYFNAQMVYKNLLVKGFGVRAYLNDQTASQRAAMIKGLVEALGDPAFQLPVAQSYRLDQFKEAIRENDRSGRGGKILLKIN